ncbi:hypothetical protein OSTOST_21565, partial [Ostertagia ostertagi]
MRERRSQKQNDKDMAEGVSTIQESENTRESSPGKLEKLVAKKTEVETDPASLKRNFQDDERIFSRSSVEFMKRKRREAVDQENRSHGVAARQQRTST